MPTFPITIVPDQTAVTDQFTNDMGPFQIGTDLYFSFLDANNNASIIFKSSDGGNTWLQDGLESPSYAGSNQIVTSVVGGTKIYAFRSIAAPEILVDIFDTLTSTWAATVVFLPGDEANNFPMSAVYRTGTDDIVLFCSPVSQDTIGGNHRCAYLIYDISTQTTAGWIPCGITDPTILQDELPIHTGCVRGTARTHFFMQTIDPISGDLIINEQSVNDAGTLGSLNVVADEVTFSGMPVPSNASSEGGNIAVGLCFNGADFSIFEAASSATPTFTLSTITIAAFQFGSMSFGSDGTIYFIYFDGTDLGYFAGPTFASFTSFGAAAVNYTQAFPITITGGNVVGVFLDDFPPMSYWFVGSGGPPPSSGTALFLDQNTLRVLVLPNPAIICDPSQRLQSAEYKYGCKLEYPVHVGKLNVYPSR